MAATRDSVLEALLAADGAPVSGEVLAQKLGVSRVAVRKHVAALRREGFEIDALHATGYSLDSRRVLVPALVRPHVQTAKHVELHGGGAVGSTMDEARRLADAGAPAGSVVIASSQTAGRGRLGRSWTSPPGGAYVSVLLRPAIAPSQAVALPLAVSLGVSRSLEALGASPRLKWPNDVLLNGRKLAGVLLEMTAEAERVTWVIVGVGLNVLRPTPPAPRAAYLEDALPGVSLSVAAAAVIDGVLEAAGVLESEGFEALARAYSERLVGLGSDITVTDVDGRLVTEGIAQGVDDLGRLVVQTAEGERAFSSGDVSLRPPTI